MSRLDRHVAFVQNKLAFTRFLYGLAWAVLIYAAIVWGAIVVDRVFHVRPPRFEIWFWSGLGVSGLAALVYALIKRPSAEAAAVAIDDRLALKEKFSTALYVRPMKDPFAQAAVRDAERTADNVSLNKRFPVEFPRAAVGTLAVVLAAFLTFVWLPSMDLFGREQALNKQKLEQAKAEDAKKVVQQALARVNATPKGSADDEILKRAKSDLANLINQPMHDPEQVKRSAAKALQDVGEAIKQQMSSSQRFADAQSDAKAFKSLLPADDEKGPVADAQRAIAKGDLDKAVDELNKATDKFDKMTEEEQKKAADQMKKMAQQLQQMAQDPNVQKQIQQQMQQQMGLNQQQAQQMQQQMQQAAQGDKQAQQQLQQQAQQIAKQMNDGKGPTQQQQQQMQQMMKQMQAQANSQQQAQQMAQAAQQMSQAMQQQQKNGQQSKNGNQQSQQMAAGKQAMQQQLQAMQAMKTDAQQIAAAQQAAQAAAQDAAAACQGGQAGQGQQANAQQKWGGNNNGQWQQGQNNNGNPKPNKGMGGAGIGAGPRDQKEEAPYDVKKEISPSQDISEGKILASTLVKAKSEKGKSTVSLQEVAKKGQNEATDEVEQDRISRQAQQAVKEYFRSVADDADQSASPTPAPAAQQQQQQQ
jgi:hypothetical protein